MFDIYVQHRFLKTPQGNPVEVPTLALAKAIEEEWEKDPSPHYGQKPLTALVATALDRVAESREAYTSYIIQSVTRDVLLFWVSTPEALVKLQEEKWTPLLEEVNKILGLSLRATFSLSFPSLSAHEKDKIEELLNHLTVFKMAGFAHLITLSSSFCVSFLILQNRLSPEEAWNLAHLHEHYQRQTWGKDREALQSEKSQKQDFLETVRFLNLVM